MITVYEIKSNGFIGITKEIDPKQGVGDNWTYTAPPGIGTYKWESGQWIAMTEPENTVYVSDPNAYKYQRASAYPSFADQFDLLYHGGYDAWKEAIQSIKDQYPKE